MLERGVSDLRGWTQHRRVADMIHADLPTFLLYEAVGFVIGWLTGRMQTSRKQSVRFAYPLLGMTGAAIALALSSSIWAYRAEANLDLSGTPSPSERFFRSRHPRRHGFCLDA
jgi:uncharacterized membrane protein YeaQ/YmgE (transglycosylase-associated protein family)